MTGHKKHISKKKNYTTHIVIAVIAVVVIIALATMSINKQETPGDSVSTKTTVTACKTKTH